MSDGDFQTYFQLRASRFAAFYSSEPVARLLGRGPLFDRLRVAVDTAVELSARRVLDVGCGSGPLFAPLASRGIHVVGIDPTEAMVALATEQAAEFPGLIEVQQRGWEELDELDAYDMAVALGVFDYVARARRPAGAHGAGSKPCPRLLSGPRVSIDPAQGSLRPPWCRGPRLHGRRLRSVGGKGRPRGGRAAPPGTGRIRRPFSSPNRAAGGRRTGRGGIAGHSGAGGLSPIRPVGSRDRSMS